MVNSTNVWFLQQIHWKKEKWKLYLSDIVSNIMFEHFFNPGLIKLAIKEKNSEAFGKSEYRLNRYSG